MEQEIKFEGYGGVGYNLKYEVPSWQSYPRIPWQPEPYTQLRGRVFEVMTDDKGAKAIKIVRLLKDKGIIKDDIKAVDIIDILDNIISVL